MKTIRYKQGKLKVLAIKLWLATYGVNAYGKYRLELRAGDTGLMLCIYQSRRKPLFRNLYVLSVLFFPLVSLLVLFKIVGIIISHYVNGAVNFYKDSAWVEGIRFFNWINIILMFILGVLLIFKW
jgi:hypothetical protein